MKALTDSVKPTLVGPEGALSGPGFDWVMIMLCVLFFGGGLLDNWAHGHQQLIGKLETFFNPWHAALYAGWLAVTLFLVGTLVRNHARGYAWHCSLPPGYGLSLVGVAIFSLGGLADMIWHTIYGFEVGVDATYSPPHLILGGGLVLIMSGPLRAAWRRADPAPCWWAQLPMVLSLTFTFTELSFFTLFAQPLINPWAATSRQLSPPDLGHTIGVASVLLHTAVLMGLLLLVVLRGPFPPGGLTLLFVLNGLMMSVNSWPEHVRLAPVASTALTGVGADVLLSWLKPSTARPGPLRVFAFAAPAMIYLVHFLSLKLTDGIWWSIHLWMGSIVVAGIVGLLMSYAFVPPSRTQALT